VLFSGGYTAVAVLLNMHYSLQKSRTRIRVYHVSKTNSQLLTERKKIHVLVKMIVTVRWNGILIESIKRLTL
jgi:hypothetical protein